MKKKIVVIGIIGIIILLIAIMGSTNTTTNTILEDSSMVFNFDTTNYSGKMYEGIKKYKGIIFTAEDLESGSCRECHRQSG